MKCVGKVLYLFYFQQHLKRIWCTTIDEQHDHHRILHFDFKSVEHTAWLAACLFSLFNMAKSPLLSVCSSDTLLFLWLWTSASLWLCSSWLCSSWLCSSWEWLSGLMPSFVIKLSKPRKTDYMLSFFFSMSTHNIYIIWQ